jgi:hypothetical protein
LSALIFVYKLFLDLRSHNFVLVDLTELGIDYIDVVVLSIPPFLNADTQFDIIKPMWKVFSFYTVLPTLLLILSSVSIARISTTNIWNIILNLFGDNGILKLFTSLLYT